MANVPNAVTEREARIQLMIDRYQATAKRRLIEHVVKLWRRGGVPDPRHRSMRRPKPIH